MDDAQYTRWRTNLVPLLYDWLANHHLQWPSQACRWGAEINEYTFKTRFNLYLSEQTDGSEHQKLMVSHIDLCKPRVAAAETVCSWSPGNKSPYYKDYKVLYHPGEVNKIREIPGHPQVVVTHTDAAELYVWNTERQPNRMGEKADTPASVPDLVLAGHKDIAAFALATTSAAPMVASGGSDNLVLLWDLRDKLDAILGSGKAAASLAAAPRLQPRHSLAGHAQTVEDVVFKPASAEELCSVGDDYKVLFWDTRQGAGPVACVSEAHGRGDIQAVDWSRLGQGLVATGASDGSIRVWDPRKLPASGASSSDCVKVLQHHSAAIMRLEWHPHVEGILASGGEDKQVLVWDIDAPAAEPDSKRARQGIPAELLFVHPGHQHGKVVDFQWCPSRGSSWALVSISEDSEVAGGTMQVWRMNDMVYRPYQEVVQELERHREFIINGKGDPTASSQQAAPKAEGGKEASTAAAADGPTKMDVDS